MDQTACSYGGAVAIDFADPSNPIVRQVDVDFSSAGLSLCVVNTGGNHADLTADYAAIPAGMKSVAALSGKETLRECNREAVEKNAAEIRQKLGDRALLRSLHFFAETERAAKMLAVLERLAGNASLQQEIITDYLSLVNESGTSSWELLQNVFTPQNPNEQGIAVALALTQSFLRDAFAQKGSELCCGSYHGACRVHGGGFAGTIQAYIPSALAEPYSAAMDAVFGPGSVTILRIRPVGAAEL
jgi:galactokinase